MTRSRPFDFLSHAGLYQDVQFHVLQKSQINILELIGVNLITPYFISLAIELTIKFYRPNQSLTLQKYLLKDEEIEQRQLEGHLCITRHLVSLLRPGQKHLIGIEAVQTPPNHNVMAVATQKLSDLSLKSPPPLPPTSVKPGTAVKQESTEERVNSSPSPPPLPPRGDQSIPPPIPPSSVSLTNNPSQQQQNQSTSTSNTTISSSFPLSSSSSSGNIATTAAAAGYGNILSSPPPGLVSILLHDYINPSSRALMILNKITSDAGIQILEKQQPQQPQKEVTLQSSSGSQVFKFGSSIEALSTLPLCEPFCEEPSTLQAAYDLLAALCDGCLPNLRLVVDSIIEMFVNPPYDQPLAEWEYSPPVRPRPPKGFVGLKNAGATCYMNSVLQQLYMIPEIRNGILSVPETATDLTENLSATAESSEGGVPHKWPGNNPEQQSSQQSSSSSEMSRKDYNVGVLKQIQAIFAHLALSKLQYYVPKGFWGHFRLVGESVNLREQHDALEFFNSLVDSLDEGLKTFGRPPVMSRVLGGTFADQKICRDCPHRYSREESFTTLNIDIRNQSNLRDSLEQYVKGDLLEGANAYHCEKCDRKVDTVKRLCIKRLPELLAIQLKRFDYDWERETAIKFNDYFEFPRTLDMRPYTVAGLADLDGEIIDEEMAFGADPTLKNACTEYELHGIVVHSGQASGGHYYSYIQHTTQEAEPPASDPDLSGKDQIKPTNKEGVKLTKKWYKFDDGEVSECKLEDDEEMRTQCFGGDYLGEVFDHMLKRMSSRRQKRWWNAYILIYRRKDTENRFLAADRMLSLNSLAVPLTSDAKTAILKEDNNKQVTDQNQNGAAIRIPPAIQLAVQKQNVCYMHLKSQFCPQFFHFVRQLLSSNSEWINDYQSDRLMNLLYKTNQSIF